MWVCTIQRCTEHLLCLPPAQNSEYREITRGYFCNKVSYCYSTAMTHCSLPCSSGNSPVLCLLNNPFTCSVKWEGKELLGLGHFFMELPILIPDAGNCVWDLLKTPGEFISVLLNILCLLEEGEAHHGLLSWPFVPANSSCLCCLSELLVQSFLQFSLWKYPN